MGTADKGVAHMDGHGGQGHGMADKEAADKGMADMDGCGGQGCGVSDKGCPPVPEAVLNGHAFHTYALTSADGKVEFQFRHNVCGRSTYAEGSVDAAVFLAGRVKAATEQRVYDMVDVLKMGGI